MFFMFAKLLTLPEKSLRITNKLTLATHTQTLFSFPSFFVVFLKDIAKHSSPPIPKDESILTDRQQERGKGGEGGDFLVLAPSGRRKLNPGPARLGSARPSGLTAVQSDRWVSTASRLLAC